MPDQRQSDTDCDLAKDVLICGERALVGTGGRAGGQPERAGERAGE
jgi:hypothetical protein